MSEINDQFIIQRETLTNIADAVRQMRLHDVSMTPADMPNEIKAIRTGLDQNIECFVREDDPEWVRPVGWPDLDSINIPEDFDGVYMTYDLSKTEGYGWIGVFVQLNVSTGKFQVERGHLENGAFVSDYLVELARGSYFRESLDPENGTVQLWRVSSSGQINRIALVPNSEVTNDCMNNTMQPMVERRGILPYVTNLSSAVGSSATNGCMSTIWLERDNLRPGSAVVTTLSSMYAGSYRLEKVALDWDTSNWRVTAMSGMFQWCYRLKVIDFSTWDTSNWVVTIFPSMFQWCMTVKRLDLSGWNTSNWRVTGANDIFSSCISLEEIDLTGWEASAWSVAQLSTLFAYCRNLKKVIGLGDLDTSNWRITTLSNMFLNCSSLEELDLSTWDTSNWAVNTLSGTFSQCYKLKKLDISTWDTSNWAVTSLSATFNSCYSLYSLDLSGWDTTNWRVTTMENCFVSCNNLKELLVPFNTSNWVLTSTGFRYTFQNLYSLESLDLSTWDTSNWTITDTRSTFSNDRSLKEIIGIDQWNTSNWRVTYIGSFFYSCHSLENVDLSNWDTSLWEVVNIESMLNGCYCLKNAAGIWNWDTSSWSCTAMGSLGGGDYSLRILDLSGWNKDGFNITSLYAFLGDSNNLEELIFPDDWDMSNVTNTNYILPSNLPALKEFSFYKIKNTNVNIGTWYSLSRGSLLKLLSKLQQTTTTRTLTLGKIGKMKLTAEEIAIATQKGWTVA